MLYEGFYVNDLIAAAVGQSNYCVSKNDSASNNGKNQRLDKKSQQGKGHPQYCYQESKMSKVKELEDTVAQLLKTNDDNQLLIIQLKSQIKKSEERNDIVAKRSHEITQGMAKVMKTKGKNFEDVNDGLANTDIAERFNNVYDREWVNLSRWLAKQFEEISELELIQSLTSLMKKCYKECIYLADEQVRQFMFLDETQSTPSRKNHEELYAMRKQYAQTDTARSKMKEAVLKKVRIDEEMSCFLTGDKNEEMKKLINEFLTEYLNCCWLMVVSNPPLALNFDVVGKQYCREHFKVYSAKQRLVDDTNDANTVRVREVVWPCVYYADRSLFFKKGDALLGTTDAAKTSDDFGTTECTCFTTEEDKPDRETSDASQIKDASTCNDGSSSSNGTIIVTDV